LAEKRLKDTKTQLTQVRSRIRAAKTAIQKAKQGIARKEKRLAAKERRADAAEEAEIRAGEREIAAEERTVAKAKNAAEKKIVRLTKKLKTYEKQANQVERSVARLAGEKLPKSRLKDLDLKALYDLSHKGHSSGLAGQTATLEEAIQQAWARTEAARARIPSIKKQKSEARHLAILKTRAERTAAKEAIKLAERTAAEAAQTKIMTKQAAHELERAKEIRDYTIANSSNDDPQLQTILRRGERADELEESVKKMQASIARKSIPKKKTARKTPLLDLLKSERLLTRHWAKVEQHVLRQHPEWDKNSPKWKKAVKDIRRSGGKKGKGENNMHYALANQALFKKMPEKMRKAQEIRAKMENNTLVAKKEEELKDRLKATRAKWEKKIAQRKLEEAIKMRKLEEKARDKRTAMKKAKPKEIVNNQTKRKRNKKG